MNDEYVKSIPNIDVIYFELNNWFRGRDYPDTESFETLVQQYLCWCDLNWIKENKLVVVESAVDMSINFCITALKDWVKKYYPDLLTKYTQFIRNTENGEIPIGQWGCPFLPYTDENIGYHIADCDDDNRYTILTQEELIRWEEM